jgi:hypothetical protein
MVELQHYADLTGVGYRDLDEDELRNKLRFHGATI